MSQRRQIDLTMSFVEAYQMAQEREREFSKDDQKRLEALFDQKTLKNCAKRELSKEQFARFMEATNAS